MFYNYRLVIRKASIIRRRTVWIWRRSKSFQSTRWNFRKAKTDRRFRLSRSTPIRTDRPSIHFRSSLSIHGMTHMVGMPHHDSFIQYRPEPPEWRLINSLRSCLPNEVNFIINTLLLYCSDHHKGKRLKLERCPHLLDILMLHAGCPKKEVWLIPYE